MTRSNVGSVDPATIALTGTASESGKEPRRGTQPAAAGAALLLVVVVVAVVVVGGLALVATV